MRAKFLWLAVLVLSTGSYLSGCSRNEPSSSLNEVVGPDLRVSAADAAAPAPLVTITHDGDNLDLWPYLTPDGTTAEDPVNLIFVGASSAMEIRDALLALDGDRSGTPFPPVYPFNTTWSDAVGGVQAGFSEAGGWTGSVIQLQLGDYGPVRVHLRLFDTGADFNGNGHWTIGGAHFDLLITDTPEHQVLSWELAEQVVMADLVRAGVLAAAPATSGSINDAPGYRTIAPAIYNGIPDALKLLCGLPTGSTAVPVPIPTDGHATILEMAPHTLGLDSGNSQSFTIQFQQVIPKPFCAAGPADYFMVQGPVDIFKEVRINHHGRFSYRSELSGTLTATPYGGGESFKVRISDSQTGYLDGSHAAVHSNSQRVAPQDGGSELQLQLLIVGSDGNDLFRTIDKCLSP